MKITQKQIAECVGLWLAEGDQKTKYEVTFTNNCFELINLFHNVMVFLYSGSEFRPRMYRYFKNNVGLQTLPNVKIKSYIDKRARKPYYVYRFASVKLNKKWKLLVKKFQNDHSFRFDILRGFFAGEGNIHSTSRSKRVRIAQKYPQGFINKILTELRVSYRFNYSNRYYVVWGRESWDKLAKIKLADLHPEKKRKFIEVYNTFKEYHYSNGFLKNSAFKLLIKPLTTKQLSKILKRTPARICDVLMELKNEKKIINFKVGSQSYWLRLDQNSIVISSLKYKYLKLLKFYSRTSDFARNMQVTWKSSYRRLNELKRLDLVDLRGGKWIKKPSKKGIILISSQGLMKPVDLTTKKLPKP